MAILKAGESVVGSNYLSRKGRTVKVILKKDNRVIVELVGPGQGQGSQAAVPLDYELQEVEMQETPKAAAPKVAAPKVEAPKAEAPVAPKETPKVETPKVDSKQEVSFPLKDKVTDMNEITRLLVIKYPVCKSYGGCVFCKEWGKREFQPKEIARIEKCSKYLYK